MNSGLWEHHCVPADVHLRLHYKMFLCVCVCACGLDLSILFLQPQLVSSSQNGSLSSQPQGSHPPAHLAQLSPSQISHDPRRAPIYLPQSLILPNLTGFLNSFFFVWPHLHVKSAPPPPRLTTAFHRDRPL